jgi:hypothetical protein
VDDFMLEKLTKQVGLRAQVEKALSKIERAVMSEIEGTAMRPGINEALKQLIVTGNVLDLPQAERRHPRLPARPIRVQARSLGHVLEIVTHERISPLEVPESIREQCSAAKASRTRRRTSPRATTRSISTRASSAADRLEDRAGVCGTSSPSRRLVPFDKCPWLALRFVTIDGEDYGRGYVEEHLGDLRSLEALQKAIVQASAAAAKVLFLVKPNGSTKVSVLTESESGDVKIGNKDDVTVLQMEKYNDFKVALETRNDLTKALSYAFMLHSAVQRDAERLTAEEIRYMANELEAGLGGIYSTMSQELQLPFVRVLMHSLTMRGRLPPPENTVRPVVTTGVEAIGRGNDLSSCRTFFKLISRSVGAEANVARSTSTSRTASNASAHPSGSTPTASCARKTKCSRTAARAAGYSR